MTNNIKYSRELKKGQDNARGLSMEWPLVILMKTFSGKW